MTGRKPGCVLREFEAVRVIAPELVEGVFDAHPSDVRRLVCRVEARIHVEYASCRGGERPLLSPEGKNVHSIRSDVHWVRADGLASICQNDRPMGVRDPRDPSEVVL